MAGWIASCFVGLLYYTENPDRYNSFQSCLQDQGYDSPWARTTWSWELSLWWQFRQLGVNLNLSEKAQEQDKVKMAAYCQKVTRYHDAKVRNKFFQLVALCFNRSRLTGRGVPANYPRKVVPKQGGPYKVKEVIQLQTYHLEQLDGMPLPLHGTLWTHRSIIKNVTLSFPSSIHLVCKYDNASRRGVTKMGNQPVNEKTCIHIY